MRNKKAHGKFYVLATGLESFRFHLESSDCNDIARRERYTSGSSSDSFSIEPFAGESSIGGFGALIIRALGLSIVSSTADGFSCGAPWNWKSGVSFVNTSTATVTTARIIMSLID